MPKGQLIAHRVGTFLLCYYIIISILLYIMNSELKELINNPKYAIFYKGKEVRRFPFYKQAKAFCLKHNSKLFGEDECELINLETGECINKLFE